VDLIADGLEVSLLGEVGQQVADADVELLLAVKLTGERERDRETETERERERLAGETPGR